MIIEKSKRKEWKRVIFYSCNSELNSILSSYYYNETNTEYLVNIDMLTRYSGSLGNMNWYKNRRYITVKYFLGINISLR